MKPIAKSLTHSAWIIIIASVIGPLFVLIANLVSPMPKWTNVDVFISNYHNIHSISTLLGFPLLYGFVTFIASAYYLNKNEERKIKLLAALMFTAIYGAMVTFNYITNSSYIRHILTDYKEIVAILTMNNPKSLCWVLEMYGYGFLGLATYLIAPVFHEQKTIELLLKANGVVSIIAAAATFFDLSWILEPIGLFFYAAWNLLIIIIMVLVINKFKFKIE